MTSVTSKPPLSDPSRAPLNAGTAHVQPDAAGPAADGAAQAPPPRPPAGEASPEHVTAPDIERLRTLAALYEHAQPTRRRSMRRTVLMLVTFAIGASAGLAATWWITGGGRPPVPTVSPQPTAIVSAQQLAEQSAATRGGISASELPYDGSVAPPVRMSSPSRPKTNPDELPYSGMPSQEHARHGAADPAGALRAKKTSPASGKAVTAAATERSHDGSEAQGGTRKNMKASRPGQRSANDREFERIRRQADEELKKKPERRQPVSESRARASSNRSAAGGKSRHHDASRTQALLANCQHAGNFIRREQCKWRLCGGKWGKHGCPSYAHAAPY